jgi:hypothetical protein
MQRPLVQSHLAQAVRRQIRTFANAHAGSAGEQERRGSGHDLSRYSL